MEEPWKLLSGLASYIEAKKESSKMLSDLVSYIEADNDSDEEEGGEYSAYKTKARGAFASPSALAGRLGKRGGGVSRRLDSGQSKASSSRRCKNRYTEDENAADIFKQISGTTGIGRTNVKTKRDGLAESAKGIVIPVPVVDPARPSIIGEDFEPHRNPIGMVINPISSDDDCVAADDVTVMTIGMVINPTSSDDDCVAADDVTVMTIGMVINPTSSDDDCVAADDVTVKTIGMVINPKCSDDDCVAADDVALLTEVAQ